MQPACSRSEVSQPVGLSQLLESGRVTRWRTSAPRTWIIQRTCHRLLFRHYLTTSFGFGVVFGVRHASDELSAALRPSVTYIDISGYFWLQLWDCPAVGSFFFFGGTGPHGLHLKLARPGLTVTHIPKRSALSPMKFPPAADPVTTHIDLSETSPGTKPRPSAGVSLLTPLDPLRQAKRLPIRLIKMLTAHTGHLLHPDYLQPLTSAPVSIEVLLNTAALWRKCKDRPSNC